MDATPPTFTPLEDRPLKDTICLFDVDGTLTPARLVNLTPPSRPPPPSPVFCCPPGRAVLVGPRGQGRESPGSGRAAVRV